VVFRFDLLLCALLLFELDAFAVVVECLLVPVEEGPEAFAGAGELVFVPDADAPEVLRR
jgi:hypothetical protein